MCRNPSGMNGHEGHSIRVRTDELLEQPEAEGPDESRLGAEHELAVAHEYDTVDRDLEQLGLRVARLPSEAGVVWRLTLPRGEQVEAWEPGTGGLAPPDEIARLIESAAGEKPLVPAPPLSADPGARRLREMIAEQRRELLAHDPGVRLGDDPENLHEHRVAARRIRAYLRAARAYLDPAWRRALSGLLDELGEATGPVRDLDVLLELLHDELALLDGPDRAAGERLLASVETEREAARQQLLDALRGEGYRVALTRLRLPPRLADDGGTVPLERIARKVLDDLVRTVDRLGKRPDEDELHRLRIALKRTRYAVELSAPAGKAGRRFVEDAKALQALLGEYQDAVVAEERLRELAVGDARTAASFVAGRLVERQQARRARLARQLPAAWRRLRKSGARLGW